MGTTDFEYNATYSTALNGNSTLVVDFPARVLIIGMINASNFFVYFAYSNTGAFIHAHSYVTASVSGTRVTLRNTGGSGFRALVIRANSW